MTALYFSTYYRQPDWYISQRQMRIDYWHYFIGCQPRRLMRPPPLHVFGFLTHFAAFIAIAEGVFYFILCFHWDIDYCIIFIIFIIYWQYRHYFVYMTLLISQYWWLRQLSRRHAGLIYIEARLSYASAFSFASCSAQGFTAISSHWFSCFLH
jgi:hypothetical protein